MTVCDGEGWGFSSPLLILRDSRQLICGSQHEYEISLMNFFGVMGREQQIMGYHLHPGTGRDFPRLQWWFLCPWGCVVGFPEAGCSLDLGVQSQAGPFPLVVRRC